METMAAITTTQLTKYYRTPFTLKKIPALSELDLTIEQGEIFGYLGPNGAGKTTTFKLLLGLIRSSGGRITLWGRDHRQPALRKHVGYLPESPYFYGYLKGGEYLRFAGALFGFSRKYCSRQTDYLFDLVGLKGQQEKLIKNYSKGMLQRLGLAQALINDPQLLIMDEPMSGLDPLGRKEVRDIILYLKDQGKTIIFSTHILTDVESICSRVGIIFQGRLRACGPLDHLMHPKITAYDICARNVSPAMIHRLHEQGLSVVQQGSEFLIQADEDHAFSVAAQLLDSNGTLVSFSPRKESLEEIYLREFNAPTKTLQ